MTIQCPTSPYDKKTDIYTTKTSPYDKKTDIYETLYFCPVLLQENSYPLLFEDGLMIKL